MKYNILKETEEYPFFMYLCERTLEPEKKSHFYEIFDYQMECLTFNQSYGIKARDYINCIN